MPINILMAKCEYYLVFFLFHATMLSEHKRQGIVSYVTFIYVTYIIFIFGKNLMMHFEH